MERSSRLNVTFDARHAAKLSLPAERTHIQEWRWMIPVYAFVDEQDLVVRVTIQDARSSVAP